MPPLIQKAPALILVLATTLQLSHASAEPFQAASAAARDSQEAKKDAPALLQVKGKVVDRNSKALANIQVIIEGPKAIPPKRTDSTGAYKFAGPAGKYKITAKSGSKTATLSVDIDKSIDLQALVLNTED